MQEPPASAPWTVGPKPLALRSCHHHTRASKIDATLYPRASPARRPLTGTPANGPLGATGVRTQVVTHMRMLPAGTKPGVEKNGQARHVWRIHTRTWCPKPTIPAGRLPQAPSPRQWASHVPHDSCATTAFAFPPWQFYAFCLATAPFTGFTSLLHAYLSSPVPTYSVLSARSPGLPPAAATRSTAMAV
jgi:hypothetical protein